MVQPDSPLGDNITRRMRFACWLRKATHTLSEREILFAFPRQKWLLEHASVSHLYVRSLPCFNLLKPSGNFTHDQV
jgi:hypothetical protein